MAAWALHEQGLPGEAHAAINDLIKANSYAMLKVLNVIDWIGEGTAPYESSLSKLGADAKSYEKRMTDYLSSGK